MMRPPRQNRITSETYRSEHWPPIKAYLEAVLTGVQPAVHMEDVMRRVYNLVCQRHSASLSNDLVGVVTEFLTAARDSLLRAQPHVLQAAALLLGRWEAAVRTICSTFRHLDEKYTKVTQGTNLHSLLGDLFARTVLQHTPLVELVRSLLSPQATPELLVEPSLLMLLVQSLYRTDKSFASANVQLFAKYVPCLHEPGSLQAEALAAGQHIKSLEMRGFSRGEGPLKRKFESFVNG